MMPSTAATRITIVSFERIASPSGGPSRCYATNKRDAGCQPAAAALRYSGGARRIRARSATDDSVDSMRKLMIAVVAGTFAAAAAAQTGTAPDADTKAKQDMVKSATEGTAKGHGAASAEGSAKAAKQKDTSKALP